MSGKSERPGGGDAEPRNKVPHSGETKSSYNDAKVAPQDTGSVSRRTIREFSSHAKLTLSVELREIARAVRTIGSSRGATPETLIIDKETAADRLIALAQRLERAERRAA